VSLVCESDGLGESLFRGISLQGHYPVHCGLSMALNAARKSGLENKDDFG